VRLVFLTLLVLDIAFFAWSQWIDVPAPAVLTPKPGAALPSLQLVGAASTPAQLRPAPAAESQAPAPPPPAESERCRSVGPFDDALAASAESDRLRARGWQPRQRSAESQVPDGYWVYLRDLKDPAAQRSAINRLGAAGIHDAAAVTDQVDRVSVGFFADQAHAARRAEQVRTLGFKPILDVHQRSATQNWIDFTLKAGEPEPTVADVLAEQAAAAASGAGPQLIPCPTGAPGG
jgi:hypothetical protein